MVSVKQQLEQDKTRNVSEDLIPLLNTEEGMRKVIQVIIERIEELEKKV